jgi:hypothetical protein
LAGVVAYCRNISKKKNIKKTIEKYVEGEWEIGKGERRRELSEWFSE